MSVNTYREAEVRFSGFCSKCGKNVEGRTVLFVLPGPGEKPLCYSCFARRK